MQVTLAFIAAGAMFFELPKRLMNKVNAAKDPLGTQRRIVFLVHNAQKSMLCVAEGSLKVRRVEPVNVMKTQGPEAVVGSRYPVMGNVVLVTAHRS